MLRQRHVERTARGSRKRGCSKFEGIDSELLRTCCSRSQGTLEVSFLVLKSNWFFLKLFLAALVFVALHKLSLVAMSRACPLAVCRLLTAVPCLLAEHGL